MNNLIPIYDFKIVKDKKLYKKSLYLTEALNRMFNQNKFHQEDYENVICPFELILMLDEVANDFDNKRGNKNGIKKD